MYNAQVLAPVAQLDRVLGYEPRGRGFESCLARQQWSQPAEMQLRPPCFQTLVFPSPFQSKRSSSATYDTFHNTCTVAYRLAPQIQSAFARCSALQPEEIRCPACKVQVNRQSVTMLSCWFKSKPCLECEKRNLSCWLPALLFAVDICDPRLIL